MLTDPIKQVMEANVMPWLFEKTLNFLEEDFVIEENAETQLTEGILISKAEHKLSLINKQKARDQAVVDAEKEAEEKRLAKIARKEDRRIKRRLKAIDEMIEQVKKRLIENGDMRDSIVSYDLDQVHGNYRQNYQVIGAIGGSFMQIVETVQAFFEAFAGATVESDEAEK